MATAKQLAWRKEFAKRAKAGTLTKRKKNPAKKTARKTARKTATKKTSINRVSQITKRAPTKRLKTRRVANSKPGYFPNPVPSGFKYKVQARKEVIGLNPEVGWKTVATFAEKSKAVEYAKALSKLRAYTAIRVIWK